MFEFKFHLKHFIIIKIIVNKATLSLKLITWRKKFVTKRTNCCCDYRTFPSNIYTITSFQQCHTHKFQNKIAKLIIPIKRSSFRRTRTRRSVWITCRKSWAWQIWIRSMWKRV